VFDWLRRTDYVDGETMELMTAIACGWIKRLVGADGDVSALLEEMKSAAVWSAGRIGGK
jgi:hypothetical protein